jgi:uncharacterized membrane protein (UPF0136 family)
MSTTEAGNPNQAVRLGWFLLSFTSPMTAVGYVSYYGLKDGNETALIHVLAMLAISMVASVFCGIAQPVVAFDEARMSRATRWNLSFAIVDTLIVAILSHVAVSEQRATFPVGWLALAGMHYCWAVYLYTTEWKNTR